MLVWGQARLEQSAAYSQRLRIRDQQRQYDRMVNNVHWGSVSQAATPCHCCSGCSIMLSRRRPVHACMLSTHSGAKPKEAEARGMYQASVALNMVTAAGTAGFVAYYLGRQVFKKESHVRTEGQQQDEGGG